MSSGDFVIDPFDTAHVAYADRTLSKGLWQRGNLIAEYGQVSPGFTLSLKRLLRKNKYISEQIASRRAEAKAEAIKNLLHSSG